MTEKEKLKLCHTVQAFVNEKLELEASSTAFLMDLHDKVELEFPEAYKRSHYLGTYLTAVGDIIRVIKAVKK